MASINKVILIGNLGKDPETRYTKSGVANTTFQIATSEKFKNKQGGIKEHTEWHRIVTWGKLAEICKEYLPKGSSVYIEGKLQTRSWDDKNGIKRYVTEIIAQSVQFLSPKSQNSSTTSSDQTEPPPFDDEVPF